MLKTAMERAVVAHSHGVELLLETRAFIAQVGPELLISPCLSFQSTRHMGVCPHAQLMGVCATMHNRMPWSVNTGGFRGKAR